LNEWKIEKSRLHCQDCQEEIRAGQDFFSRLFYGEGDELLREDYCIKHWPPKSGEAFCFWKSTRAKDENKGPRILDSDSLLTLFQGFDPKNLDTRKMNFRYLVALVLMRKKILKELSPAPSGKLKLSDGVDVYEVQVPTMNASARLQAEEDIASIIVGLPEKVMEKTQIISD
jgi:hypothetical protein